MTLSERIHLNFRTQPSIMWLPKLTTLVSQV